MSTSPRSRGGGLHGFRLAEVPIEIRLRAAASAARSVTQAIPESKRPEDRLFLRLIAPEHRTADEFRRVAEAPSERVYWISVEAWERVMKQKRARR